ncbi:hypothetical protein G6F61_014390 [Rhizopus arrhizus]|nr:hypothetical protein G6F61_014390 [Rhizopus arrhizus]
MTSTTTSRRSMRPPPTPSAWNGVRSATCWVRRPTPPSSTSMRAARVPVPAQHRVRVPVLHVMPPPTIRPSTRYRPWWQATPT